MLVPALTVLAALPLLQCDAKTESARQSLRSANPLLLAMMDKWHVTMVVV
jgi:hypothetical protein